MSVPALSIKLEGISAPEPSTALNSPTRTEVDIEMQLPGLATFDALYADLQEKPLNAEGWKRLVSMAEASGDMNKIKRAYDGLLVVYPNTSSAQVAYINHFLSDPSAFGQMKELFQKFLVKTSSVDLCRFYLTYVRRTNTDSTTRNDVAQSYELALKLVGQDKDSGDIWSDYIRFLDAAETRSTWEQQQKMDSLRRVYQRAIQIPLENVQKIWEDYESFENGLNRTLAKKFMADLSPSFIQARQVLRELRNHLHPLWPQLSPSVNTISDIYLPPVPTFDAAERALVGKWKAYLKWEESNPLLLEDKDKPILIARIQMAYRKAIVRMRYYPEIWYIYYIWLSSVNKTEEAVNTLQAGLSANPSSYLLTFAYAETQELNKDLTGVRETFDKLIAVLRVKLEDLQREVAKSANSSLSSNGINDEVKIQPDVNDTAASSPSTTELDERRKEFSLVWIMYMRFSRRAEGEAPSRTVFKAARREKLITWEVYEAAAFMEYNRTDNQTIPARIFDMGLERFPTDVDYVLRYLGWLLSIKDEKNARVLFERVIGTFSPDKARPLWERWARYEYQYSDLQAAHKLEKRMAEIYPNDPPLKRFAQRQMYLGIDAIADRDLGFALARRAHREGSSTQQVLQPSASITMKRAASPDHSRKARAEEPLHKKARQKSPMQPPPPREKERDRDRDWSRDRERDRPPPPPRRGRFSPPPPVGRGRDMERGRPGPSIDQRPPPAVLVNFLGRLPSSRQFDGPVFKTDDLMKLFVGAQIPSSRRISPPPPPAPRSAAGRPPPDYGPYRGPQQPPARWGNA